MRPKPKAVLLLALGLCLNLALRADVLRLIELHYHSADDSTFWHAQPSASALVDKLWLAPGDSITARFQTNGLQIVTAGFKQPRVSVFALNISNGDPEFLREARNRFPGWLPTLVPVNWQALSTTLSNGVVTAATANFGVGTFRVRLAAADGTNAVPSGDGLTGDWLYGDCYVVIASSPNSLDVTTAQRRHVYFRGESIPATILLRSRTTLPAGRVTINVMRGAARISGGTIALPALTAQSRRSTTTVATRDLAPGPYTLTVAHAGLTAAWPLEIVDPVSPSVITISENEMQLPFADPILSAAFGWPGPDALAHGLEQPYADLQVTTFRNEMLMAPAARINRRLVDTLEALHAGPAPERVATYDLRQLWMDGLTRLRMSFWAGVQGRGLSFTKANTLPGTEDEVRRQLVALSRDYAAWANFFGPQVDVDTAYVPARQQLGYAGLPEPLVKAFQERMAQAQEAALRAAFPNEVAAAGTNAVAWRELWGNWYRGVWPRTDAKDQAALALLSPVLWRTANREYHHGGVHDGHAAPDLYRGLDVQQVEAWGDPLDNIMLADSWANLGAAARRASGCREQPLWIESQTFIHETLGYLQTRWWGVLANGADGVGYAANVFGLRGWSGIEPHRANFRRQVAAATAREVRTLGPALRLLERERRVAILFSKTEADREASDYGYNVVSSGGWPPYVMYFALTFAGYQPDFILDEQVVHGDLEHYQVLYLTRQQNQMAAAVKTEVAKFVGRGGKLMLDATSTPQLFPTAIRLDLNPGTFSTPNVGPEDWKWIDAAVPKLRAALDPLLTPLPGRVAHPRCVVYWLRHAASGCQYAVVINKGYAPIQTTLVLAQPLGGYDLMTGQRVAPTTIIPVDLRNLVTRIYAFTPAAVGSLAVKATPNARAGDSIALTAALLGADGQPMATIAPATFRVTNARGEVRWERWTPIGPGLPPAVWETAASEEPGPYTATITELLTGKTATFPVVLRGQTAGPVLGQSLSGAVDRRALGKLWHTPGAAWSVVLATNQTQFAGVAEELAQALRRRGLPTQVWRDPATIRMPVGYRFTPEQQQARDRVFAGEVIGARDYIQTNDAPNGPTWEPWTGTAIYRNVIFFEDGNAPGLRVGLREFSGDHDAVYLQGRNAPELRGVIRDALALKPTAERLGPETGREALARGYLLEPAGPSGHGAASTTPTLVAGARAPIDFAQGRRLAATSVRATITESPITWAEQIGRPIQRIDISPSGQNILVTHEGLYVVVGQFAADGAPVRTLVREPYGDDGNDVRGIDNAGAITLASDADHYRSLLPSGETGNPRPAPLWQSADGQQSLRYEPDPVEGQGAPGPPTPVTKRKLIRQHGTATVFASVELGNAPGKLYPSPTGQYLFQPDDGQPGSVHLSQRLARLHDDRTGKLLWEKKGWLVYPGVFSSSIAWSADGESLALVRNYPNGDYHGLWPEVHHRCLIVIVRAADGEVLAEGAPTTWVEKMLLTADGRFAVGVPEFVADHYWLLEAGKGLTKVHASDHWLYSVELDAAGQQLFTLDLAGTLRRQQPTGAVLWSQAVRTPGGPVLGILKPLGADLLLGSAAGRLYRLSGQDGHVIWQRTTTDSLDGKMIGGR